MMKYYRFAPITAWDAKIDKYAPDAELVTS